ncbi:DUF1540 domain-containing protein [Desulfocurvibacter africanus]|uniref:DUF1540 domain-containing protein n=1 Tax=Desulfocurvibacter africanus subsp. africanus str. Walvis Bay TaxID=690850 RepID=F3YY77_DESAF|nr:DUF1540 domain-containing protein [Desulfocurvibacter africanus]EGJ51853.1 hypothetical protein Desaf_3573 [Desulfocurvibacter africanus subsp. africanus str. Walvis Bay]
MAMKMPTVQKCSVSDCAYNTEQACHALAITIGEKPSDPLCDTFFTSSKHGGIKEATAGVGACKSFDCSFNRDYECTASSIQVGMKQSQPDCLTFQRR